MLKLKASCMVESTKKSSRMWTFQNWYFDKTKHAKVWWAIRERPKRRLWLFQCPAWRVDDVVKESNGTDIHSTGYGNRFWRHFQQISRWECFIFLGKLFLGRVVYSFLSVGSPLHSTSNVWNCAVYHGFGADEWLGKVLTNPWRWDLWEQPW